MYFKIISHLHGLCLSYFDVQTNRLAMNLCGMPSEYESVNSVGNWIVNLVINSSDNNGFPVLSTNTTNIDVILILKYLWIVLCSINSLRFKLNELVNLKVSIGSKPFLEVKLNWTVSVKCVEILSKTNKVIAHLYMAKNQYRVKLKLTWINASYV